MVQGLKIQVHFKIDLISAPGTLISESHGDVYINVRLFNTHFRHGLLKMARKIVESHLIAN